MKEKLYSFEELENNEDIDFLIYEQYEVSADSYIKFNVKEIDEFGYKDGDTFYMSMDKLQKTISKNYENVDPQEKTLAWVKENCKNVKFTEEGEVAEKFQINKILPNEEDSLKLFVEKNFSKASEIISNKNYLYSKLARETIEDYFEVEQEYSQFGEPVFIFEDKRLAKKKAKDAINVIKEFIQFIKDDEDYGVDPDYTVMCNIFERWFAGPNGESKIIKKRMSVSDIIYELLELESYDCVSFADEDIIESDEDSFISFCLEHNVLSDINGYYVANLSPGDFDILEDDDDEYDEEFEDDYISDDEDEITKEDIEEFFDSVAERFHNSIENSLEDAKQMFEEIPLYKGHIPVIKSLQQYDPEHPGGMVYCRCGNPGPNDVGVHWSTYLIAENALKMYWNLNEIDSIVLKFWRIAAFSKILLDIQIAIEDRYPLKRKLKMLSGKKGSIAKDIMYNRTENLMHELERFLIFDEDFNSAEELENNVSSIYEIIK